MKKGALTSTRSFADAQPIAKWSPEREKLSLQPRSLSWLDSPSEAEIEDIEQVYPQDPAS
jgi:hypothetical protein